MRVSKVFVLSVLVLGITLIAANPIVPGASAAMPKATCFRTFLGCRTTCIEAYAPDEAGEHIINNPTAQACLLDCDLDLAACVVETVGGGVISEFIKAVAK